MMFIGYKRHSYRLKILGSRISDRPKLFTENYDLDLTAGHDGEPLIDDNQVILEIKVERSTRLDGWNSESYQVEEISFSKYGRAYSKTLEASEVRLAL